MRKAKKDINCISSRQLFINLLFPFVMYIFKMYSALGEFVSSDDSANSSGFNKRTSSTKGVSSHDKDLDNNVEKLKLQLKYTKTMFHSNRLALEV